jgi:carboxymethylenebutenolidase
MRMASWMMLALCCVLTSCGKEPAPPVAAQEQVQRMDHEHGQEQPTPSAAALATPEARVVSRMETYATISGQPVQGYVAYPAEAEGALPGLLMFHEWWGLNDNIKSMANQLAAQGYVVLAADFYSGRVGKAPDEAKGLMQQAIAKPELLKSNIAQAYDYVKDHMKATRVGAIGWCFGGTMSFEAGKLLADNLSAVVIYYGFVTGGRAELASLKAPVLGIFGGQDQAIALDTVHAFENGLTALGRPPQVQIYGQAGHGFANPSGQTYRAADADDAWAKTTSFLRGHLQEAGAAQ